MSNSVCLFSGCPVEGETDVLVYNMPVSGNKADGTTSRLTDGMYRIRNLFSFCMVYLLHSSVSVPFLRSQWAYILLP